MNNKISYVDYNDEPDIVYCPYCEKVGVKFKLQERVFDADHPAPYDADNWMQCYRCGRVIPIYEVKEELDYQPIVDIVDSPFETGSEFGAVKDRKHQDKKRRKKKDYKVDKELAGESGEVNVLYDSQGNY